MDERYLRGWEDAVEYCLSKVSRAKSLEEAKKLLEDLFWSVKEKKIEELERRF